MSDVTSLFDTCNKLCSGEFTNGRWDIEWRMVHGYGGECQQITVKVGAQPSVLREEMRQEKPFEFNGCRTKGGRWIAKPPVWTHWTQKFNVLTIPEAEAVAEWHSIAQEIMDGITELQLTACELLQWMDRSRRAQKEIDSARAQLDLEEEKKEEADKRVAELKAKLESL